MELEKHSDRLVFQNFIYFSTESEDPPSVNPSSVDDIMEFSDPEKDTDGKQANLVKSSASMSGLDEYEFKDEEEEEEDDLSKALNDRHILRREQRQREKDERDGGHFLAKQDKGSTKSKKSKTSRVLYCSSDSSSDEAETPPERKASPTCSLATAEGHRLDSRTKKDLSLTADHKEKGKVKKKYKNQSKNKENQELKEDGKENSKVPFFSCSASAGTETAEKAGREEDSFKMSFSPKDDSSVHLFHLPSARSPKLNHNLVDKQPAPLKQENAKTCLSVAGGPCQVDGIKQDRHTEPNYSTESCSSRGAKHKEKSKHHHKELNLDAHDRSSSPCKEDVAIDNAESALRKTDKEGKVVKKYKLKHGRRTSTVRTVSWRRTGTGRRKPEKRGTGTWSLTGSFGRKTFSKVMRMKSSCQGGQRPLKAVPHTKQQTHPLSKRKRGKAERNTAAAAKTGGRKRTEKRTKL